jgi:hypothetical protein
MHQVGFIIKKCDCSLDISEVEEKKLPFYEINNNNDVDNNNNNNNIWHYTSSGVLASISRIFHSPYPERLTTSV